jgi:uncharacterized Zn-finger protein
MTLKTFLQGYWFQRIVLFVWLASSAIVFFSQKSIDAIVHGTLYSYGLQFSTAWAQPYWTYANTLYYSQYACIALSTVALAFSFLNKNDGNKQTPKIEENEEKIVSVHEEPNGRSIVISCASCKKAVSKPLVMLDFGSGKAKLVNVCPYCNAILGSAEQQNDHETIVDPGKEVLH